jgi:hypothetical protein
MAKLTGAKKKAFLDRMARGRRKAARKTNGKKRAAKKRAAKNPKRKAKKNGRKLTGAKKAEFLRRMARGRKAAAKNPRRRRPKASGARKGKTTRRKNGRRRNQETMSDAEHMYEVFHGRHRGQIVEYDELVNYPDKFAELGQLRELRFYLDEANPRFPLTRFGAECRVVCTPDGENIYFVGGDQSIDLQALDIASDKNLIELGPCVYIAYKTTKDFHDFEPIIYEHQFGEEDRILPTLAYDTLNQRLLLMSGNYRVERAGIVN